MLAPQLQSLSQQLADVPVQLLLGVSVKSRKPSAPVVAKKFGLASSESGAGVVDVRYCGAACSSDSVVTSAQA